MSKKRDSAAQLLRRLIEEEKKRERGSRLLRTISVGLLADPILRRARELKAAVCLEPSGTALKKAFRAFDLDPNIPENWHRLINYLARSHFELKRAGARLVWSPERREQLLRDF